MSRFRIHAALAATLAGSACADATGTHTTPPPPPPTPVTASVAVRSENFEDSPAWSPDGTRIAYRSATTTSAPMRSDIYVMNADGSAQVNLSAEVPSNAFLTTPV